MYLYGNQFSENHDLPRVDKPEKTLIIASTPRSGSHMLGHALHETGCFGFPLEYANPPNVAEWKRRLGKERFDEVLVEIQQRRTSSNGVFGIKIHYDHIRQFGSFRRLQEALPNAYYVLLTRSDVLRQAVSLAMARQTGVWIGGQQAVNENPQYSFDQIDGCLRETLRNNAAWRYVLAAHGCRYMEVDFLSVRQQLGASIQRVAQFMAVDLDVEALPAEHVTQKQGDGLNAEWEQRYLAEFADAELFPRDQEDLLGKVKRKMRQVIG